MAAFSDEQCLYPVTDVCAHARRGSAYPESAHQCGGRLLCGYGPRPYRETAGSTGEAGVAIVYLPFLLPPVLMHNQNPFRTTWSCWCELFLVFMLVAFYLRGTRLTRAELTAVVVLGALAASWRSECVYYLAAIPVMLAVLCCKKLLRPLALGVVTALILCGYMASSRYTGSLMGEAWQYQRIALCYQMAALVQDADPAEDAAELAAIDKIYDVDYCRSHPEIHGAARGNPAQ